MQKSIWQNSNSIRNENSQQSRNRKEVSQPDILYLQKTSITFSGKRQDAFS